MPKISAFADEIGPDPKEQLDALDAIHVKWIELRGVKGVNVMKFSTELCEELRSMYAARGFGVSAIGSPIGKIKLDADLDQHFDDFKHAVDLAEFFSARFIRIFSYYPPEGKCIADYREQVVDLMAMKLDYIQGRDVTLALENESHLFGAVPERCAYLHAALPSKQLVAAFDPANFVNMNVQNVFKTAWLPLRENVNYIHIKDFKYGETEHAVPAGEGDGCFPEILADAASRGYDNFLALEPHLAKAEHSTGVTGPDLFKVAADALRKICKQVGWDV